MGRFWVLPGTVLALALASPAYAGHHGHSHGGLFLSFGVAAPAPLAPYPYAYYPYPYAEPYASPVVVQAVEPPHKHPLQDATTQNRPPASASTGVQHPWQNHRLVPVCRRSVRSGRHNVHPHTRYLVRRGGR